MNEKSGNRDRTLGGRKVVDVDREAVSIFRHATPQYCWLSSLTFGVLRALLDAQFLRHLNSLSFPCLDDVQHAM